MSSVCLQRHSPAPDSGRSIFSPNALTQPTCRAGVPTIIDQSFEFLVRVDPAAKNVPTPQVISGTTVEFAPRVTPVLTRVFLKAACRLTAARGKEIWVNTIYGAQKTKSSSSTCEKIDTEFPSLHALPTMALRSTYVF